MPQDKTLIIVESPTKTHTIQQILGSDYIVEASKGHIRDLKTTGRDGLGVDLNNNYKTYYGINDNKKEIVALLKKEAKQCKEVILATDPDREGEAISWHIAEVLNLPIETTKRLEFHEITKNAILKALQNPRTIDLNLVASQETRRIIDRIIGFKLSKLLQRKLKSRSAGRVQSVTLRFIVDRENQIKNFVPEEYWTISGLFENKITANLKMFKSENQVIKYVNKEIDENNVDSETLSYHKIKPEEVDNIISSLPSEFVVEDFSSKTSKIKSKAPFTTSTMQQNAFSLLNFSTKKTASLAQKLYEGVEIEGELRGLITYIRTDSERLAPEFVESAIKTIESRYGKEYVGQEHVQKSGKNIQDAHEAIRPTDLSLTPEYVKPFLNRDQYKLYKLIYSRALASLMAQREEQITTLSLNGNGYIFETKASKLMFEGYSKVYGEYENYSKDSSLNNFKVGDKIKKNSITPVQHFTKAPSRYTEGKIVRLMEEKGIGRPSTFASTISTLEDREYITLSKGVITPTEQGEITVNKLVEFFPEFMDYQYTANMESNLDHIVAGDSSRKVLLDNFCRDFYTTYLKAEKNMEKLPPKEVGISCPICGKPLIEKKSRYGTFIACSGYPTCTYVMKAPPRYVEDKVCPQCGSKLVYKQSARGEFIACSNYPACKYIYKEEPKYVENEVCPDCGHKLVIRHSKRGDFISCSNYPNCKYTKSLKKSKNAKE